MDHFTKSEIFSAQWHFTHAGNKLYYFYKKKEIINDQPFIQALLFTAVFPQRFSFFSVCLAQWLCRVVAPW